MHIIGYVFPVILSHINDIWQVLRSFGSSTVAAFIGGRRCYLIKIYQSLNVEIYIYICIYDIPVDLSLFSQRADIYSYIIAN